MVVTFFNFKKKSNSTAQPSAEGVVKQVTLKDSTNIYTPLFVINEDIIASGYNYLKWDNRFYYINDITIYRTSVYNIQCAIDFLATGKSDILNTDCFVTYSSSKYNIDIADTRLSQNIVPSYAVTSATLFNDAVGYGGIGTYILNYSTSNPGVTYPGIAYVDSSNLRTIMSKLNSNTWTDIIGDTIAKEFGAAYTSINSVKSVPFNWSGTGSVGISLGSYDTGASGQTPKPVHVYSTSISIPWGYNDFRNGASYTTFLLYLAGFGFMQINADQISDRSTLSVKCVVDGITGDATYIVGNFARANCCFATTQQLGSSHGNVTQAVTSFAGAAISASYGNSIGALGGAFNSISALMTANVGTVGNAGDIAGAYANIGDTLNASNIYLVRISHNTTVEPSTMATTYGRPLNEVVNLSTLTGYVETTNASVKSYNQQFNDYLNTALNGGIYIE